MNDTHTVHDLAALYAMEALEPEERPVFEHHLHGCPHCQAEIAGYAEVRAHLAEAVAQQPPPGLRASVLAAISDTGPRPACTVPKQPAPEEHTEHPAAPVVFLGQRRQRRRRRLLAAAAAAVLVPGLVLGGWVLGTQSEHHQQLTAQKQSQQSRLLGAPDLTTHSLEVEGRPATVLVSQEQGTALFLAADLPDPSQAKHYQLWLIHDGTPVPDVHVPGGQVRTWLDGNITAATAVAITIEASGSPDIPTPPFIAATRL